MPENDPDEPPVAGQPANFNGAVGSYQISARAEPMELQAEDPLTFVVLVTGSGRQPPRRPNLRKMPSFTKRFAIEDLPDPGPKPGRDVWEFRYRLKPLNAAVVEIPPLRFDYYKPGIIPREKGYRTTFTQAIPLTVKARSAVQAADVQGTAEPNQIPERFYRLVEGPDEVLRHDQPFVFPDPLFIFFLLLTPPALCGGWFMLWRYFYPEAARQTRQRQSRAARQALHDLNAMGDGEAANRIAAIAADYLRQRWNLSAAEPTPMEVAVLLRGQDFSGAIADQAAEFFRTCDVARFAPDRGEWMEELKPAATRLIVALEG